VVLGTAQYMSPEQARGVAVDARTDIWSLGCLIYEMLSAGSPFARASATDTLVAIREKEPTPLRNIGLDIPAEIEWIVTKALRKTRGSGTRQHTSSPLTSRAAEDSGGRLTPGECRHGGVNGVDRDAQPWCRDIWSPLSQRRSIEERVDRRGAAVGRSDHWRVVSIRVHCSRVSPDSHAGRAATQIAGCRRQLRRIRDRGRGHQENE
jgi:serine/threonine protein kinase